MSLKNIFSKKDESGNSVKPLLAEVVIPKGWYVSEAGQDLLHMLWFVVLVNFDDVCNNIENPRHFIAEEKNSFNEALLDCVDNCR